MTAGGKKHGKMLFVGKSLTKLKTIGSFFPSSRFLARGMLKSIEIRSGISIVELGAGTGAFTKEIIKKIPDDGILFVFEIEKSLCNYLSGEVQDKRVLIICDDATNMAKHLRSHGKQNVDYIISGLPLANMSQETQRAIIDSIKSVMTEKSRYIQFQYLLGSLRLIKKYFEVKIVSYELRNFPPAFIYECRLK